MRPTAMTTVVLCCTAPWAAAIAADRVPRVRPQIVRTLPHDTDAYTQGLLFHEGRLYESTGRRGQSSLRCLDPADGRVLKLWPVKDVFAEGIAVLDGRLVQLTWQEGIALVYTFPALDPEGALSYEGEGWGLASDGSSFLMSDGSDVLTFRDADFVATRTVRVTLAGRPLPRLNELEYVDGRLFANVLSDANVFEIDTATGAVVRIIDCSEPVGKVRPAHRDDVLNGIAHDPVRRTWYLTGKRWPCIFEVKFPD